MSRAQFFVLPTLGENFGYVFVEAMAAGSPLMISDNTIWEDLEPRNAGWRMSLKDRKIWVERIKYCLNMGPDEYLEMSINARKYALDWLNDEKVERMTDDVLQRALG